MAKQVFTVTIETEDDKSVNASDFSGMGIIDYLSVNKEIEVVNMLVEKVGSE